MKSKSYEFYARENLKDIQCTSGYCDSKKKKKCDKEGMCLVWLCRDSETHIAGKKFYENLSMRQNIWVGKKVKEWRKAMLKICRKVKLTVEESK